MIWLMIGVQTGTQYIDNSDNRKRKSEDFKLFMIHAYQKQDPTWNWESFYHIGSWLSIQATERVR